MGSQTNKHILVHFELKSRSSNQNADFIYRPIRTQQLRRLVSLLGNDDCRMNCLKMNYRTGYAKHSASTAIRPIGIKCEMIMKTVKHHRQDHSKFQATIALGEVVDDRVIVQRNVPVYIHVQ